MAFGVDNILEELLASTNALTELLVERDILSLADIQDAKTRWRHEFDEECEAAAEISDTMSDPVFSLSEKLMELLRGEDHGEAIEALQAATSLMQRSVGNGNGKHPEVE